MDDKMRAGFGSPSVDEIRWARPVYPGATLRVETKVLCKTASRSRPQMDSYKTKVTVCNQDDAIPMRLTSIGLICRCQADE